MTKFKLNISERLTVMNLLPKEGSFITLKVIRDTVSILGIQDKEFKEFGVKQEGERVSWNSKGNEEKIIELGEKATDLIVEALKKLNEEKKLEQVQFSLFEKFVDKKEES